MPFAYYGAKHRLAPHYPPPRYNTIIEPFAGSAAYSIRWATDSTKVILYEADEQVVELWHRVQNITPKQLDEITEHIANDIHTTDPLVAALGGGSGLHATLSGLTRKITPRMREGWPNIRRRIERSTNRIKNWEINHGSYEQAPNIEATWFIDPPYQLLIINPTRTLQDQSGNAYRYGQSTINYAQLAAWCKTRQGQTIVCEQQPAAWLPFKPFKPQRNAQTIERTEVIWTNETTDTAEQLTIC